jgi:hypothetical protein
MDGGFKNSSMFTERIFISAWLLIRVLTVFKNSHPVENPPFFHPDDLSRQRKYISSENSSAQLGTNANYRF